jgi:uncharacterized protein (TIGR02271 family)
MAKRASIIPSAGNRTGLDPSRSAANRSEQTAPALAQDPGDALTTNQGLRISDNQNSLRGSGRGPTLLEDHILREKIVPVIVEELDVQTRQVESGAVRLTKTVHEHERLIDPPLWQEEVEVKRLTVNRMVDGPLSVRYEGDTMIVPILEEVLIVEKRFMLKEELHISKRRVETHTPQRVTVRSEEVTVERIENPPQKEGR